MLLAAFSFALVLPFASGLPYDCSDVCKRLSGVISSASNVYYPGQSPYTTDIFHWANSSSQSSTCSFEPGTANDLASVLEILGSTKTPFAVKSGGHSANPNFSSTLGVHISMSRFSQVIYDNASQTATIGAGLIWDDVYAALEPFGVTVLGGRLSGIGVAGFTLNGGYSWKTNQHGLTIDSVKAFELVLPNGTVATVTENTYPDLFFGLRGGGNNFGIVTKFTLQTYQQGQVWGGQISYNASQAESVSAATAAFSANCTDPKAQIITSYVSAGGVFGVAALLFYDGPSVPSGVFDEFLSIPHLTADVQTRSFIQLLAAFGGGSINRGYLNTVAVRGWTPTFLAALVEQANYWGSNLTHVDPTVTVGFGPEPFLTTHLTHSNNSAFPTDWARSPSAATNPLNIYFTWSLKSADQAIHDAMKASAAYLKSVVVKEFGSQFESAPSYPNYSIYDTPLGVLYDTNLPKLKTIAQKYDPHGVMKLAGGFRINS